MGRRLFRSGFALAWSVSDPTFSETPGWQISRLLVNVRQLTKQAVPTPVPQGCL